MKNRFKLFGLILAALFIFTLTACDDGGSSSSGTQQPALTGTVTITGGSGEDGAIMVGDDAEADITELNGNGTPSYQWYSSDTETGTYAVITNQTSSSIYVNEALIDKWIKVTVTRAGYSGSIPSSAVEVHDDPNRLKGTVTIPDTVKIGEYINLEDWFGGDDLYELENAEKEDAKFQWQVSNTANGPWEDIEGETFNNYSPDGDIVEAGMYIRVKITTAENTGNIVSNSCLVEPKGGKEITGIEVSGPTRVYRGQSNYYFNAMIDGKNLEYEDGDYDVTWEVSGNSSEDTYIDEGQLYVASEEEADKLTITATSVFDEEFTDTITVSVFDYDAYSITITGLDDFNDGDFVIISLWSDFADEIQVCGGEGTIDEDKKVKVFLEYYDWDTGMTPWKANGEYYIRIGIDSDYYLYTAGDPFDEDVNENAKFKIEDKDTTIDFADFELIPVPPLDGFEITITNLDASILDNTLVQIFIYGDKIYSDVDDMELYPVVASGFGEAQDGEITIILADWTGDFGWKGEPGGTSCRIVLFINWGDDGTYVYTKGDSLADIDLTAATIYWDDFYEKAPTYDFWTDYDTNGTESFTIDFDQFVDGSDITSPYGR
jgi:hypothetical protein